MYPRLLLSFLLTLTAALAQQDPQFARTVRPFVDKYCVACHSGNSPAAQFDLKSYDSADSVIRDFSRWNLAAERLAAKEMPPKQAPQPPEEARKQVIDWIHAVRAEEIRRHDGDPGLVPARRLSNAEYNYTIRDLTGVDMRPTREFPVDPANPAGFDNSAESLTMSPALLSKYLQAAREVASHMVLTPDGIDFAPYPMLVETDRDKYCIERIVNFYFRQPTDYAAYFAAAWRYQHRAGLGKPNATLATTAADAKIGAKYLPMVWQLVQEPNAVGPVAKLQSMFRELQPETLDAQCAAMREFVVRIRKHTAREFAAPAVDGMRGASQPLMLWKLRAFATHRRDFDRAALRNDTDPPLVAPPIPGYPRLEEESAPRNAALMLRSRVGDQDLIVPAAERARYEAAFARFASVFPDAFYISERGRYYPDDSEDKGRLLSAGYHNVMGYFRDDQPLMELILDDKGQRELNRLWDEFDFIADYSRRTWIQYFLNRSNEVLGPGHETDIVHSSEKDVSTEQVILGVRAAYLKRIASSGNGIAIESAKSYFDTANATIRAVDNERAEAEPKHVAALLKFAARAYRRPLTKADSDDIVAYYRSLREKNALTHEEAIRDSVAGILMSPDFLYRVDLPASQVNAAQTPVSTAPRVPLSGYALASRLSYFLWSSMPDDELLKHAAAGDLQRPDILLAQTRRMLKDERVRDFATEFAGNWLDFRRFETFNSVDRDRFPAFTNDLREAMFQEPIRFIEDTMRNDRSVLDMIYGNYTFVNPVLAKHYGIAGVTGPNDDWTRIDDAARYHRGGLLPMAVFLTNTSPGLRTSPVKRGYWVVHRLLGETIPPPPPVVPELPHDESKTDLPLRDVLAQHRANPVCASCHARFDVFGLAFEGFGPVGDARTKDLAGRPVDTSATFPGGVTGTGLEGVRSFIREHRQSDFCDGLSRKMLAYALSRSLQLSDEPLVGRMEARLRANGNRFNSLVETIVASPQFLNRRNITVKGE